MSHALEVESFAGQYYKGKIKFYFKDEIKESLRNYVICLRNYVLCLRNYVLRLRNYVLRKHIFKYHMTNLFITCINKKSLYIPELVEKNLIPMC